MDEDSNASVLLIADDITLKTLSPNWEINVKKMVLDGCGKWITGSVQGTSIFCSVDFTAMKVADKSDSMAAVENWQLKVDLVQEPCLAKYKNRVALVTLADAVTVMIKDEVVVNQIINAISFEEIKARDIIEINLEE
jgi:hypothetical protein